MVAQVPKAQTDDSEHTWSENVKSSCVSRRPFGESTTSFDRRTCLELYEEVHPASNLVSFTNNHTVLNLFQD